MDSRELILLSPYRIPAKDSLYLGDEDVAAFLNGYSVLWHPALVGAATEPPKVGSPYDYESPTAGHVYAVPESPQLFLAEDWEDRVRNAGAVSFRTTPERKETLANLHEVQPLPDLRPEQLAPFFGLAFGYLHLLALFEAMDHENLLATAEFWQAVQRAADATLKSEDPQPDFQAAADKLMAAREALYPTTIHLLDLFTLDDLPGGGLPLGGLPLNLITSARGLESFLRDHPESAEPLKEQVRAGQIEICLGSYVEREDALLPIESQFWNLLKGLHTAKDLLGSDVRVFARRRFGAAPQLPLLLSAAGLERALAVSFDDSASVSAHGTVVHWTAPNGKQIEVFTRNPYHADAPGTYFHAAYHLHQTIAQDFVATFGLACRGKPASPWHEDWLQLARLAPVLGRFETLSNYFGDVVTGEQASTTSADDFPSDYLTDRTERHVAAPVSWFARQARLRRRVDTIWTLAALHCGLAGQANAPDLHARLEAVEDQVELDRPGEPEGVEAALTELQGEAGAALASRLLARATGNTPGYLVLNSCNFTRRVAIEVDISGDGLPLEGPLKACQVDSGRGRLVVEVPALGFAWVPRQGNTSPPAKRIKLADERHVRNEFFEAEIDPATGGLRGLWDPRSRISRVGQMLVYDPGSTMRASSVRVTSAGPALGEVVSEGAILGDQQQVLATFRQRFRAWLGRPILELRVEIFPEQAPKGYPWHAYFGARFAWRDERATLLRGVNGTGYITSQTRPDTPDYLEWRLGRQSTTLFPGGLPFHQRHGSRMLDVVLVPEGEEATAFELGLGLDREYPMQTAFGMISPVPVIPVEKGPPHVGAAGWLFHVDAANLLLTSMRPAAGADAVVARVLECALHSTQAEFRCVRNPARAYLLDAHGEKQSEAGVSGDAAHFEVAASDCTQLRVEFG